MLVSIVVPIFNVQDYLEECLQSLINQSYKNLDIVLVDDGSSDESLKIALKFAKKDKRIFIVQKPNGGLSSARNTGIEFIKNSPLRNFFENKTEKIDGFLDTNTFNKTKITKTKDEILSHFTKIDQNHIKSNLAKIDDFIVCQMPKNQILAFVDSDDFLDLQAMQKCKNLLREREIAIFDHFILLDETTQKSKYLKNIKCKNYKNGLDFLSQNKLYDFYFAWCGAFKAEILNRYNLRFTNDIFNEDNDFGVLLFANANKIAILNEPLYFYRQRSGSITNFKELQIPKNMPKFLEPLRENFTDYRNLRAYFKAYCKVIIAYNLFKFSQDKFFKQIIKRQLQDYFLNFYKSENFYQAKARNLLSQMGYKNLKFWHFYYLFRKYLRNPKMIFHKISK